jgi:hypothetical protein
MCPVLCVMVSVMELAVEQFKTTLCSPCALCIVEGLHLYLFIHLINIHALWL